MRHVLRKLLLGVLPWSAPFQAPQDARTGVQPSANASAARAATDPRKAARLRELADRLKKSLAPLYGEGHVAEYRHQLSVRPANAPPVKVFNVRLMLAEQLLFVGEIDEAVRELDEVAQFAQTIRLDRTQIAGLLHKMAIARLRIGERANCVTHHNEDSCIFPLRPKAVHEDKAGATAAAEYLVKELDVMPESLPALWLLNVVHMQIGDWPDGVPERWRIPASAFESEYDIKRFVNVASKAGLDVFNRAGGAAMDDFNDDGLLDVMTSSSDPDDHLRLFLNKGDGRFEDVSERVGLRDQIGGLNFIHADFDNDRRLDVFVVRGAWCYQWGAFPPSLLLQQPDGTFRDATAAAGIEVEGPSQTAAVADIDNDGDLDLYVGYEVFRDEKGAHYPCRLYENRGDATFTDVTERSGASNEGYCKGSNILDSLGARRLA